MRIAAFSVVAQAFVGGGGEQGGALGEFETAKTSERVVWIVVVVLHFHAASQWEIAPSEASA